MMLPMFLVDWLTVAIGVIFTLGGGLELLGIGMFGLNKQYASLLTVAGVLLVVVPLVLAALVRWVIVSQ